MHPSGILSVFPLTLFPCYLYAPIGDPICFPTHFVSLLPLCTHRVSYLFSHSLCFPVTFMHPSGTLSVFPLTLFPCYLYAPIGDPICFPTHFVSLLPLCIHRVSYLFSHSLCFPVTFKHPSGILSVFPLTLFPLLPLSTHRVSYLFSHLLCFPVTFKHPSGILSVFPLTLFPCYL